MMKRLVHLVLLASAVAAAVMPAIPVRVGWCRMTGPLESIRLVNAADRSCICCPPAKASCCSLGAVTPVPGAVTVGSGAASCADSCNVSMELKGSDSPASARPAAPAGADLAAAATSSASGAFAAPAAASAAPALAAAPPGTAPPLLRVHLRI